MKKIFVAIMAMAAFAACSTNEVISASQGDAIEFKYDDKTLMTSDIVKILGRQPAAIGVVGNLFFAKVSA